MYCGIRECQRARYCDGSNKCTYIFFFQAEGGIRYTSVTGVQTCALPISTPEIGKFAGSAHSNGYPFDWRVIGHTIAGLDLELYNAGLRTMAGLLPACSRPAWGRSEEGRVGKECINLKFLYSRSTWMFQST